MNLSALATKNRWALINKKSFKARTSMRTRDDARSSKRPTERIYDTATQSFVR